MAASRLGVRQGPLSVPTPPELGASFETVGDAKPTTRYVVFSATKGIVASAAWILIGEGKLGRKSGAGLTL